MTSLSPSTFAWTICAVCLRPFDLVQRQLLVPQAQLVIEQLDFVGFDSAVQSLRFYSGSDVSDAAAVLSIDESLVQQVRLGGVALADRESVHLRVSVERLGSLTVLRGTANARDEAMAIDALLRAFASPIVMVARKGRQMISRPADVQVIALATNEEPTHRIHSGAETPRALGALKGIIGPEAWRQLFAAEQA